MADNNGDEQKLGAEQVEAAAQPAAQVTAADALAQKQNRGSIVDNSITQQPNTSAPAESLGGAFLSPPNTLVPSLSADAPVVTPLQERINSGENILLENSEDADSLKDGSIIVYAMHDTGMSIGVGSTLVPYAPYLVGDDLPLELAQRLVANRICAVQGSSLDPYASK